MGRLKGTIKNAFGIPDFPVVPEAAVCEKLADLIYEYRVLFLKSTDQRVNWQEAPRIFALPRLVRSFLQKRIDEENNKIVLAPLLEGENAKS